MAVAMNDLDFTGRYATRNRREDPLSSNPAGLGAGDEGRVWYNTTTKRWLYWNGTTAIDARDRANGTGTQTFSTISDGEATVKGYRWNEFAVPNASLDLGSQRATNAADPVDPQDLTTRAWVLAQLAGLTGGQVTKGAVKVAADTNISLSSPGANVDGVAMSPGDLMLLTAQTTGTQDGPYVWNGAAVAATRAPNWDSSAEAVLGSYWVVRQGTYADQYALLTNDTPITLGTDTPTFIFIGSGVDITGSTTISVIGGVLAAILASGGGLIDSGGIAIDNTKYARYVEGDIPSSTSGIVTVTGALVTINHNLNCKAPTVVIAAGSVPVSGYTTGDIIGPGLNGFTRLDANNVVGTLPAAPAANNWAFKVSP